MPSKQWRLARKREHVSLAQTFASGWREVETGPFVTFYSDFWGESLAVAVWDSKRSRWWIRQEDSDA